MGLNKDGALIRDVQFVCSRRGFSRTEAWQPVVVRRRAEQAPSR